MRGVEGSRREPRASFALIGALLVIALTTLGGNAAQVDRVAETTWTCLVCGEAGATDVLLNLLLFLPLGLSAHWCRWSWRRTVAFALLLTTAVEATQALVLVGRDASLSDVLANTSGAALGWLLMPRLPRWTAPDPSHAHRGASSLILLSTCVWLSTGWGLQPEWTDQGAYVGQLTRQWSGHDPYPGRLDSAGLNGVVVPNDPLASTPILADSLVLQLWLTRRDPTTPTRPVSILRVVDRGGQVQVSLGQRHEDLLFSSRVRANRFRVRTPTFQFADAARLPTGEPARVAVRWQTGELTLRSRKAADPAEGTPRRYPLSTGLGWVFVHPFAATISDWAPWWTAAWLALWMLPLGWCLGWSTLPVRRAGLAVAIVVYPVASILTGLPIQRWEVVLVTGLLALGCRLATSRRSAGGKTPTDRHRSAGDGL